MPDLSIQITVFLILFARIGAVVMALPVFSDDSVPAQIRLLLALGLTLGLDGLLAARVPVPAGGGALIAAVVTQAVIGMAIGMLVRIVFSAATMAGAMISLQIGLSSVLVPDAGGQVPLLSRFVAVSATVACMAMGVHHLWIAAIVHSYDQFPVGLLPVAGDLAHLAVLATARAMALAVNLSAPLIVYAILFNTALGLAARMAPTLQVFFVAQPLNILFGLTLLAVTFGVALTGFCQAMIGFVRGQLL
ncbi:flagellar biosynthetic protein FliR [Sphingomonas sp. RIT328]|uniref:flagellar biosynthetic protein FliR n=1 Tax=Sphingomonas sp. RIT328 TaxID=1470591 RepID=UPI000447CB5D|nr:flagellar biosynthetic protein FliR [Sphingomonas sp. RIT328]EZP48702.1 Flagellar biosynthetic protein fliR [Sphingomonas sp. RIT328]